MLKLNLIPIRNGLLRNSQNSIEILVTISAAHDENQYSKIKRPLDLSLVIDRSGSMDGRPLEQVKQCASKIIDQLSFEDSISIIAYDHEAKIVVPRQLVAEKEKIATEINQIFARGSTDIFRGWTAGCQEFPIEPSQLRMNRILLLSDGMANRGVREILEIGKHVRNAAERGVTTSTYGIGHSFNEHMMSAIASAGSGKPYFGQTSDDLMNPFLEELELIRSIIATKVRLRVTPSIGVSIELLNNYSVRDNGWHVLPDVASGGEVWALIKVRLDFIDPQLVKDGEIKLFTADLSARDVENNQFAEIEVPFYMPVLDQQAYQKLIENEKVSLRKFEILAAREQIKAYNAAINDDWDGVNQSLKKLNTIGNANPWVKESTDKLRRYANKKQKQAFAKEAHYKGLNYSQRMAPKSEPMWKEASESDNHLPNYLRRRPEEGKR